MLILNTKEDYENEVQDIENDAIIECYELEIELLEIKLKSLVMQNQKKLRILNRGQSFYKHFKTAYMLPEINKIKTTEEKWINHLKVAVSLFIITWGGGISELFPC